MALVNASSVCNKTFILDDFFTCWDLDILFLTETWACELSVFEELCPSNCRFISTPISAGRGGGVAMVFKKSLKKLFHRLKYSVWHCSLFHPRCSVLSSIGILILVVLLQVSFMDF